ncbi:hypothetical protein KRX54_02000 [Actinomycetaceae bacterium TAE3-ERU4]|nr:hypothetical protein [Actinomycetaceae bacterium TAE3-ERU4]
MKPNKILLGIGFVFSLFSVFMYQIPLTNLGNFFIEFINQKNIDPYTFYLIIPALTMFFGAMSVFSDYRRLLLAADNGDKPETTATTV